MSMKEKISASERNEINAVNRKQKKCSASGRKARGSSSSGGGDERSKTWAQNNCALFTKKNMVFGSCLFPWANEWAPPSTIHTFLHTELKKPHKNRAASQIEIRDRDEKCPLKHIMYVLERSRTIFFYSVGQFKSTHTKPSTSVHFRQRTHYLVHE